MAVSFTFFTIPITRYPGLEVFLEIFLCERGSKPESGDNESRL